MSDEWVNLVIAENGRAICRLCRKDIGVSKKFGAEGHIVSEKRRPEDTLHKVDFIVVGKTVKIKTR